MRVQVPPGPHTKPKSEKKMGFVVYLLKCRANSLYCGYTNNLSKRILAHKNGKGGRYTRSHLPVRLVYTEKVFTQKKALQRERQIKKLSRKQKLALLTHPP